MSGPLQNLLASLHQFLVKRRIRKMAKGWPVAVAEKRPVNPAICVTGFFTETLGIGRGAHMTAAALREAGYPVTCNDIRPLHRKLLSRKPEALAGAPEVWLIHANPPETCIALLTQDADSWRHTYRIGYWVWETDRVPADWLWAAQFLNEIWVPSDFVRNAFIRSFEAANQLAQIEKLKVMPHPVNSPAMRAEADVDRVTCLTLFDPRSSLMRKNPEAAIKAWRAAFSQPSDQARLIVKTLSGAERHPACQAMIREASDRPDIVFVCETLDAAATERLIAESDVVLSLHRGEGFSLPLAEAMAAGKAVLATGWSGNMHYMTPKNSILVPYSLIPADKRHNGPEAQWAEPDIAVAAEGLKRLISDQSLRQRLGARAQADIRLLRDSWTASNLF